MKELEIYNYKFRIYENGIIERYKKRTKKWSIVISQITSKGYLRFGITSSIKVSTHRLIAHAFIDGFDIFDETQQIDHINRIKNDNNITNLRVVNNSKNQMNRNNTKGYSFHKKRKRYVAFIMLNRKSIYLGSFKLEEDASRAYQEAKIKYHIIQ